MAATGKTPILLYGSTTPTNAPAAGNLTNSSDGCEIAINVADKNLFFKDATNAVNTVPIRQSSASSNGWLSSTDWSTFNNKVSSQWTTTGSDIYYSGGQVGIGNAPSAWSTSARVLDLGIYSSVYQNASGYPELTFNSFQNTSNVYTYKRTDVATRYSQTNGSHTWYRAPSGTLNTAITWTTLGGWNTTNDFTVSAGNLVIGTSGKGIDFSATPGTGTSELLADYEEGTFTVTLTPTTSGSITVNSSFNTAQYTKVGRLVTVSADLSVSAVSSPVGAININLPYTIASPAYAFDTCGSIVVRLTAGKNLNSFCLVAFSGGTTATIYLADGNELSSTSAQQMQQYTNIYFTLTYVAA